MATAQLLNAATQDASNGVASITDENFGSLVLNSETLVLVEFYAPWCASCKGVHSKMVELANDYAGAVKFFKLNVDDNRLAPYAYWIQVLPTVLFFKNGEHRYRLHNSPTKHEYLEKKNEAFVSNTNLRHIEVFLHYPFRSEVFGHGNGEYEFSETLANGSPTNEFPIERGLRQGDPLSPFRFLLAAEGFNVLMKVVVDANMFSGYKIGRTGDVNFHKSMLTGVNVSDSWLTEAALVMNCRRGTIPFVYLGLPIGGDPRKLSF
ncbi:thioredoxin [Medicago truncatula]|uniref:Thioredoxin n=1 Tax=Medicago truncatula TaxID=3880 RepID=A0A072VKR4_MEDTR|nr:thioredoxin [Medicago truncatula]